MTLRPAQTTLRLDAPPGPESRRWQDGAAVLYAGRALRLRLDTGVEAATLRDDELHLPLPPQAGARQVQDAAEAWLRREAEQRFAAIVAAGAARRNIEPPRLQLSFATRAGRGGWTEVEPATARQPGRIKCNWRLIELAPEAIEVELSKALAAVPARQATPDLFGSLLA